MKIKFSKKIKNQSELTFQILVIAGILVLINFLASQFFYRFDLTENKDYSLSSATKKVLNNLDDLVTVKLYFSKNLPPQLQNVHREVKDILAEYKNYSHGKIRVEDVVPQEEDKTKLMILGLREIEFNVYKKGGLELGRGYLGGIVYYQDKKEVLPVISDTNNLEYRLTTAIKKLTLDKTPTVAFAQGEGEADLESELTAAKKKLEEEYRVTTIDLSQASSLTTPADVLIIYGPTEEFSEKALYVLDQLLMRGKGVLVAVDGVGVDRNLQAKPLETGLNKVLSSYGIRVNKNLIIDTKSYEIAGFMGEAFRLALPYPFWPLVLSPNFNQDLPATANLQKAFFPWASSVDILENKIKEGTKVYPLAKTTSFSYEVTDSFNLNPNQSFRQGEEQYTLGIELMGSLDSYFQDKENPFSQENQKEQSSSATSLPETIKNTTQARLAVVGDSDFARDNFANRPGSANLVFFQNLVDSLGIGNDLAAIRAKGVTSRPLKILKDNQKNTIKYLNILGSALVVMLFGFVKYNLRKRR